MESLAERLIGFRAGKWLTQDDFGKLVGASKAAVSRWEAGISVPRAATMVRIEGVIEDNKE
jgi:transcriptional regulator with XRE-family HTH domain